MLKFVVVLYRRPDVSPAQFHENPRKEHGAIAELLLGLRRNTQNHVVPDPNRPHPGWDAVVELFWDDWAAMEAAWKTPEGERATSHLAEFVDLSRSTGSVVSEELRRWAGRSASTRSVEAFHRARLPRGGSTRIERLSVALIALNLVLLLLTATPAGPMSGEVVPSILRAHALELVDERGVVRTRLEAKPGGEVLLQLFDQKGVIKVKLGACEEGSGLILARQTSSTSERPKITSITLPSKAGEQRIIAPQ